MRTTILTLSLLLLNAGVQALPTAHDVGSLDKRTTAATAPTAGTVTTTTSATQPTTTCVQTYVSVAGDTCTSIGATFGLSSNAIYAANTFLNCNDIWAYTPICIPPGGSTCTRTIYSTPGATCDSIGSQYGVSGAQIKAWNSFLTCNDIWTNTPVCVRH